MGQNHRGITAASTTRSAAVRTPAVVKKPLEDAQEVLDVMWLQHSNFFRQIVQRNPPLLYLCFHTLLVIFHRPGKLLIAFHGPGMEIDDLGPYVQLRPNSQCGVINGQFTERMNGFRCRLDALEQFTKRLAMYDFL